MPDSEPQYIGRYRAHRIIGSGAFATVWLAEDETLNVPVAIKVLAENWSHDEEVRRRFIEEARILWRADSDHIVRIHNVDSLPDGRPYFVMDLADRGTLHERMRGRVEAGGQYSIEEAIALSLAIADGLKVAHALGIVHRDLKPANVMFQSVPAHHGVTQDEKLILTDFGMAKSVARSRGTTIATGTPYYMAPEQTEGKADERSDIYSAGVVLFELLAGRVPYPYDSPGRLFAAQVSEPPTPITTLRADVPPAVAETLHRALAVDPAQRWPGVEAWADALIAARKGEAPAPLETVLPGVDPDVLRTMAPSELAAARGAKEAPPAGPAAAAPGPAEAAGAPPQPPRPTPPPAPPTGGGGRKRRRRALVIGGPVGLVVAGVAAAVIAIVVTGAKTADAKTLTLDPVSALGRDPFTPSVVPTPKTPVGNLDIPTDLSGLLPSQLVSRTGGTSLSKLRGVITDLLRNLNLPLGSTSRLRLGRLGNTPKGRSLTVNGSAPGLYGGTQLLSVCDKRRMIAFLRRNLDKARAWAKVQGISVGDLAPYISRLTDVVLQLDTRVTNHGYKNGLATDLDEVLQRGTAVLIDEFGIPRARCYCGNPLTEPRKPATNVKIVGKRWPGFSLGKTVEVKRKAKAPEFGTIDVLTGSTAVYKKPGASPQQSTLKPRVIRPVPLPTSPTVATPTVATPTVAAPTVTSPTATAPTGTASLQFAAFDDRVGSGSTATPDGTRDAHFQVAFDAGSEATVTDVVLETTDEAGNPCCGQVWNTAPDGIWILGVYRDGTRLNPTDSAISDHVSGPIVYDVYANDSGYFKTGQGFAVTVTLSDGRKLTSRATLGAAAAPKPTPAPPPPITNITAQGSVAASSTYSSQYAPSYGADGNVQTSWFSVGDKEGNTSSFTWLAPGGREMLIDHIQLVSNAFNGDARVRSGFTFRSVQVSVLKNRQAVKTTTIAYPSVSASVDLHAIGDALLLTLIDHTDPTCGGFGELRVFGRAAG